MSIQETYRSLYKINMKRKNEEKKNSLSLDRKKPTPQLKTNLPKNVLSENLKIISSQNRQVHTSKPKEIQNESTKNEDKDKTINIKKLVKITKATIPKEKEVKKDEQRKNSLPNKIQINQEQKKSYTGAFKTRQQYLIDNKIKFKSIEKNPNFHPNSKPKIERLNKPIYQNKIRPQRSFIKKEVEKMKTITISQSKDKKALSQDNKNTIKPVKQNFVRTNMKKVYNEQKRVRPINIRKYKLKKGNLSLKYQKNTISQTLKEGYGGKGANGLDDFDTIKDDINAEDAYIKPENDILMELDDKIPVFSKGFINREGENDDITPVKKLITQRLTTALKSSLRKCVPLDTELKFLSKEFRYLLSDRKEEIEKLNQLKEEELNKKLDFNKNNMSPYKKTNIIKEENTDSVNKDEGMTDEDIAKLEQKILLKVLEENFGYTNFLEGQLSTIQSVLNNKKTLSILPPGGGKALCYELTSLVIEGLTIVISPLLSSINSRLLSLPQVLSGASLTSFTTHRQRDEIFDAIKSKNIKILFITPERFSMENFSDIGEISLICYEDATSACPMCHNYRSSFLSCESIISKMNPSSFLLLSNSISHTIKDYLVKNYQIDTIIDIPVKISDKFNISISKDANKLNGLLKLLRNPLMKSLGITVIFCNTIRTVNKITSFLNQNGLSASSYHSNKDELERQVVQNNFMKDKIKILVCTSSFSSCLDKKDVRLLIVFEISHSIEQLIQQFGKFGSANQSIINNKKEAYCHIFLNDEDYFLQRKLILSEHIDKTKLLRFIDYIYMQVLPYNQTKIKRNYNESIGIPSCNSQNGSRSKKGNDYLPSSISLNFTSANDVTDIKKQTQLYFLKELLSNGTLNEFREDEMEIEMKENEEDKESNSKTSIKLLGIGPCQMSLRFYKTSPEILSEKENNIKIILEHSKERDGAYTFNTLEVCELIGISHLALISYLYKIQTEGEITYETKEEGAFLLIKKIPDNYKDIIAFFDKLSKDAIDSNIRKLNCVYILLRQFSCVDVEAFKNVVNSKEINVKCLNTYNNFNDYQNEIKKSILKYFENSKEEMIDVIMAGDEIERNVLLPIYNVETQKEKSAIIKEIEDFTIKEVENNITTSAVDVINILYGITVKGKELKTYKSSPLWGKYLNYNYEYLFTICESAIIKAKSAILNKGTPIKKNLLKKK